MHRATGLRVAGSQRAGVGVQAGVFGEQARVDVQHPAGPGAGEEGRQDAHVAGEGDQLDALLAQRRIHQLLVRLAVLSERAVIDGQGLDPGGGRGLQAEGGRGVGEDQRDLGRIGRVFRRRDQSLHVGAATGDEDGGLDAPHVPI